MTQPPTIFLDLDGVLNDHTPFSNGYCGTKPECVGQLNRIIEAVPDTILVISSAWRYLVISGSMNLVGFSNLLLSHGVECHQVRDGVATTRIVDVTCSDEDLSGRGLQIRHWLNENGGDRQYVVIDDGGTEGGVPGAPWTDLGIDFAGHPVVWTDGGVGLTSYDADRAIAILRGEHEDI